MSRTERKADTNTSDAPAAIERRHGRSLWSDARRKLMRDKGAMVCFGIVVLYALLAIGGFVYEGLADWKDNDNILRFAEMADPGNPNKPPSLSSWRTLLGTDWEGKPVILGVILGAKVSMTIGLMVNVIAVPVGMVLGAIAGYYGRWFDDVIVWFYTTLLSIPGIILLIAMKYAFNRAGKIWGMDLAGMHGLYVALGVISWIGTCRYVRAEAMKIRELDYVVAARAAGRHSFAILLRHVMPNVMHLGVINFSLGFVGAITSEVILSYLGLGVPVGTPSWGSMISSAGQQLVQGYWWELTGAVVAMFIIVLALNILGDRLRDALDPRLRTA